MTINAPAFRVFEALTSPEHLGAWWGQDVVVEADEGGRYEVTLPEGRIEGTITAIDGPETLAFSWPVPDADVAILTSVHYELVPKGAQTVLHVVHRAPKELPGDWAGLWTGALESLKGYLEGSPSA